MGNVCNLFSVIVFSFNPLLAVIYSFIRNKEISPYLFSFFISALWAIAGYNLIIKDGTDIALYYAMFDGLIAGNIEQSNAGDFYTKILFEFLHQFNLNSKYILAISAFFYMLFLTMLMRVMLSHVKEGKVLFLFVLLLFTHYPLLFTALRYHHALLLYVTAIFYVNKNIWISYICLFFSVFFHFAMFPLIVCYFLAKRFDERTIKKIGLFLIILTPFYMYFIQFVVDILNKIGGIGVFFASKITGYWLINADRIVYPGSRFFVVQEFFAFLCVIYYCYNNFSYIRERLGYFYCNILILLITYSVFTVSCFDLFFRTVELFDYMFIFLSLILSLYSTKYLYLLYLYLLLGVLGNISDGGLLQLLGKETVLFSFF